MRDKPAFSKSNYLSSTFEDVTRRVEKELSDGATLWPESLCPSCDVSLAHTVGSWGTGTLHVEGDASTDAIKVVYPLCLNCTAIIAASLDKEDAEATNIYKRLTEAMGLLLRAVTFKTDTSDLT